MSECILCGSADVSEETGPLIRICKAPDAPKLHVHRWCAAKSVIESARCDPDPAGTLALIFAGREDVTS